MITPASQSILEAYETLGLSVSDISEQNGLEPDSVKAVLYQFSRKYRDSLKDTISASCKENKDYLKESFGRDSYSAAKEAIAGLLYTADCDAVRFRAAKFVIDEEKGRNDMKALQGVNINVGLINEQILKARAARTRALGGPGPALNLDTQTEAPAIDIEATPVAA